MLAQRCKLGVAVILCHSRLADRLIALDLEVRVDILPVFAAALSGRHSVDPRQQIAPPLLRVDIPVPQIAYGQLTFKELEFGTAKRFRDLVFIDLEQIHLDAIDLDAGVVCLHRVFFIGGRAVAAAADESRGIAEGVFSLGAGDTGIGHHEMGAVRDIAQRQQAGVVVIGDHDILRQLRFAVGRCELYACGIQIHVGGDVVRQGQRLSEIEDVSVRVDVDAVGDVFGVFPLLIDHDIGTAALLGMLRSICLGQVLIRGNGDGVGGLKGLSVAGRDLCLVGIVTRAAGRAGDAIPFLISQLGKIGNLVFLLV